MASGMLPKQASYTLMWGRGAAFLVRAAAGDLGALDEYSEWVRGVTPEE